MQEFFKNSPQLMIKQVKEMFEIVIDWETANKYAIYNSKEQKIGFAAERSHGIFHKIIRNIMRSHRSIDIDIWNSENQLVFTGKRPWYFFFSDLIVKDKDEKILGEIKTRFGILKRKYDLFDQNGKVFGSIESYRWRLWTFTIYDHIGKEIGIISKKWGGVLKEVLTDSDQFTIDYSNYQWTDEQRAVLLFSCLSIDLDFFEDNSSSVFSLMD